MKRLVLVAFLCVSARAAEVWQPFKLASFDGRAIDGQIAMLDLPENRARANSRKIRVAVVRLPGKNVGVPIVFLSGGPGIPATGIARVPPYFSLFDALRELGDVILIDQRGSGMSMPNLICPEAVATFVSDAEARAQLEARVRACATTLQADLAGYSTGEIVEDVDAARRLLHAEKVRLLAFSYGSEVALAMTQKHPDTIERVVFASTRGPDRLLKSPRVWDAQLETFGVRDEVAKLVQQLDTQPRGGVSGGLALLTMLRADLSDGRAFPKIKPFVEQLAAGDFKQFDARAAQLQKQTLNLMTLAIDCSSGWSSARLRQTVSEAKTAVMRNVNLQWDPRICRAILPDHRPRTFAKLKRMDVPALFITGTLDVNAPPFEAEALRSAFRTSEHLVVKDGSHETLPRDDVQRAVLDFFRRR